MKRASAGVLALLLKIGGKLLSVLVKLVKALKVGKLGLAGLTMGSYAYLFTWQFALLIMASLVFHECGHIWAMRRCGMRTKGIYFIPFVGGAAVTEEAFPSRSAEVFIAIMGPIWGLALSVAMGAVYFLTRQPFFAAAASWMAMLNLFNLLPINPLDGGRIFKSIAFSVHSWVGLNFLAFGILATGYLVIVAHLGLFLLLLIIGTLDLIIEYRRRGQYPGLSNLAIWQSTAVYVVVAGILWSVMSVMSHEPGAAIAMKMLQG